MKNITIIILLLAAAVFGGLYFTQTGKVRQAQATADALQQNVSELQSNVVAQEKQTEQLHAEMEQTRSNATAKLQAATKLAAAAQKSQANQAAGAAASVAVPGQTNAKPANPMAEMFKTLNNPEMKDAIKTQQKAVLGPMIDKNYAKLFSDLNLSPEQSATLKDMLLNKQLDAAGMGMSLLADDMDATKRADLVKQVKAAGDEADAKIKELLGADNFAQFQTYEKSMPERMTVSTFKDQLGVSTALADDQEQQLIQAMGKERAAFKFTTDFSDQSKFNGDFAAMFTEDKMNTFFDEFSRLNQQYLAQAQTILSPDQYTAFEKYLKSQQAVQKAGLQMTQKMFSPAK